MPIDVSLRYYVYLHTPPLILKIIDTDKIDLANSVLEDT